MGFTLEGNGRATYFMRQGVSLKKPVFIWHLIIEGMLIEMSTKMKRQIRIAVEFGHSDAQTICRQLFEKRNSVPRGVYLVEEKRDGSRGEERHRTCTKQFGRDEKESNQTRIVLASKKYNVLRNNHNRFDRIRSSKEKSSGSTITNEK